MKPSKTTRTTSTSALRRALHGALAFGIALSLSTPALAGKKTNPRPAPEPVRAEGAFYPDEHVPAEPEAMQAAPYDPYLVAGVGGLFTAALAGGLAFVVAGRRLEPRRKRARVR